MLDPVDGRVVSAHLGGRERLVTEAPTQGADWEGHFQWGMFVMAPWAARIADGRLQWRGQQHRLPVVPEGNALHGLCHDHRWQVEVAGADHARLTCDLDAVGWPFGGTVVHDVAIAPGRLHCALSVTAGATSMPAWIGWHPCFARPTEDEGDLRLRLRADEVLVTEEMIPTGERAPVTGDLDLRDGPVLGDRRLDHAFVAPTSPAVLTWPDLSLEIAFDDTTRAVIAFTPAHVVCVEPQTGWPDALRLDQEGIDGTGVTRLGAGDTVRAEMDWRWSSSA